MGWFSSVPDTCGDAVEELRANVQDLLDGNSALQVFASEATLKRFLVARSHNVSKATQALRRTLRWRAEFRPNTIEWDDVKACATGGRLELLSQTDKSNRPILLYRIRAPAKKGTTPEEYMQFWVHALECTSKWGDNMGVQKAILVFDMYGYNDPNTVMPNFTTRLQLVQTAQAHYPERLGLAVVCNPPLLFWTLWKAIQPFLDPVTKSKVIFACSAEEIDKCLSPHIPPQLLYKSLGGMRPDDSFEFQRMENLMRSLDGERKAELSAAALLNTKAAKADGDVCLNARPLANGIDA